MKRIVVMTPADARLGFSLAGVVQTVLAPEQIDRALRDQVADPACGVILVDERLAARLEEGRLEEIERGWHGVLMILPAPKAVAPEVEDPTQRLIRRVIGYQVRLSP